MGDEVRVREAPVRPAIVELTLVRLREFLREPEALFWTFGFPLLLAAGLGIAFRSRPPETVRVGVLASAPAAARTALDSVPGIAPQALADDSAAAHALRTGAVAHPHLRARRRGRPRAGPRRRSGPALRTW